MWPVSRFSYSSVAERQKKLLINQKFVDRHKIFFTEMSSNLTLMSFTMKFFHSKLFPNVKQSFVELSSWQHIISKLYLLLNLCVCTAFVVSAQKFFFTSIKNAIFKMKIVDLIIPPYKFIFNKYNKVTFGF